MLSFSHYPHALSVFHSILVLYTVRDTETQTHRYLRQLPGTGKDGCESWKATTVEKEWGTVATWRRSPGSALITTQPRPGALGQKQGALREVGTKQGRDTE